MGNVANVQACCAGRGAKDEEQQTARNSARDSERRPEKRPPPAPLVKSLTFGRKIIAFNSGKHPMEGYDVESEPVGVGGYGTVRSAKSKKTNLPCVVKTIRKSATQQENLRSEIEISMMLDHPNIVKILDVYEDAFYIYIVSEACDGGEVLARILEGETFTEREASIVASQLFHAVFYMHSVNVAHRDLKLENLLLLKKDVPIGENQVKIIDFGFAQRLESADGTMDTYVGSAFYVAPEILKRQPYGMACDFWSCGVMLYIMLSGKAPFDGLTDADILKEVQNGTVSFGREWTGRSKSCQELLNRLMDRDVSTRITAEEALQHPWILQGEKAITEDAGCEEADSAALIEGLRKFQSVNQFKRTALHLVAYRLNDADIHELKQTFHNLDKNGDGRLGLEEIKQGCKDGVKNCEEIYKIFDEIDTDHSNSIDYTEFIAATMDQRSYYREELLWEAFRVFDEDHNGRISLQELQKMLGSEVGSQLSAAAEDLKPGAVKAIMDVADENGDGEVDFEEFVAMMKS